MLLRVLHKVYSKPRYIILALLLALILMGLLVWLPNINLVGAVLQGNLGVGQKLMFVLNLFLALPFTYGKAQATYTVIIAFLFGLNAGLLVFYMNVNRAILTSKHSMSTAGGLLVALLGLGCASCGALLLTPLLGTAVASWLLVLPYQGMELSVLSICIILWSTHTLVKKIDNPYG